MWTTEASQMRAGRNTQKFRQQKHAARKLLHQLWNPAILGLRDATRSQFQKPASAGFLFVGLFLAHDRSFGITGGQPESSSLLPSLPDSRRRSKPNTTDASFQK